MLTCKKFLFVGRIVFDPSISDNAAIQWASENGKLIAVKSLLQDKRVDPSAENNSPIKSASRNGHSRVVELLLQDNRVDPFAQERCTMYGLDPY